MATAKKAAPKAATTTSKTKTPAKASKPVVKAAPKKAPVSKTAKAIAKITASIAKLTERKDKLGAEIQALRDQRTALKAVATCRYTERGDDIVQTVKVKYTFLRRPPDDANRRAQ